MREERSIAVGLHPRSADGAPLDATFDLVSRTEVDIVYHFKAGARGSDRSVNADYHAGLELVLERLATVDATITTIAVQSSVALELPIEARTLQLAFPIRLVDWSHRIRELRMDITRAQKSVARRPGAKPGGGNDQKEIRIAVQLPPAARADSLAAVLIGP